MDICVDFDGTCVTHEYPNIGKDIGAVPILQELVKTGHRLILFTMRDTNTLDDAVNWFHENNIPLHGIQTNPLQQRWTSSPKAYGQLYIDEAALGAPLMVDMELSDRPFINWKQVRQMLVNLNYL